MGDDQLRLYRTLSRAPFPKSYVGKVFLTAFFGTHVPLLALLVYFVRDRRFGLGGALRILSVTVPATLGGTAMTLWAMYSLSEPTALASKALKRYLDSGELPDLPVGYTDRAGRLMADVQYTIERLDEAVRSLGGTGDQGPPHGHLQPQGRGRAPCRRRQACRTRRRSALPDVVGPRPTQAYKRCVRPPRRGRLRRTLCRGPGPQLTRGGLDRKVGRRRVRGRHVEHARCTADQAGAGAHRRGPAREPRSAARRRRDAPHLQRSGVPVEAG